MADYIYTMETRLTPDQQRAVSLIQGVARHQGTNLYLTGGTIRDIISGFPIRDLDLTVQGNPLKLQKELERAGAVVEGVDDEVKTLYLLLPGNVRAELGMAHTAAYEKPGKAPTVAPGTISDDLRRRDFTVNAMALSLNEGSRGLLLDPSNGAADLEAKVLRILHNYSFLDDPSRLIRATRFSSRFHWPLEERTQARYDAAKENNYIQYISDRAIGVEIQQLAHEEDPLHILKALEKEGWLKVLHPHWSVAKVDTAGLSALTKARQQMTEAGISVDPSAAVMYFITRRLSTSDVKDIQKRIPRRQFVETWRNLEQDAAALAKRLKKEGGTPSSAWKLLESAKPEDFLFLQITARDQGTLQKIKNYFGKWRQLQQKLPLPEMAEMRITRALPEYPELEKQAFLLLLDGKLRSRTEIQKFLKPFSPPPPPPPPPPPAKRGRGGKKAAKGAVAAPQSEPVAAIAAEAETGKKKRGKKQAEPAPAAVTPDATTKKLAEEAIKSTKNSETGKAKAAPPANSGASRGSAAKKPLKKGAVGKKH
jgi:tRNA nucleotidyltransferase/poly(A) polymerase